VEWAQALGLSQPVLKRKLALRARAKETDGGGQPAPCGERWRKKYTKRNMELARP